MKILKKIGTGFTADVFLLDDGKVLKLFNENYAKEAVEYEANIVSEINRLEIPSPKIYGIEKIENKYGIVYDYIQGSSMFDVLMNVKDKKSIIKKLAHFQIQISQKTTENMPSQKVRFEYLIKNINLDEKTKSTVLNYVKNLPEEKYVCHGDFHLGNLIKTESRIIVLDWMNCHYGNREIDFIRSILMLKSPYIPLKLHFLKRISFRLLKNRLGNLYKKEILKNIEIKKYKLYESVAAAVRLSDKVPGEEKWLKRIIKKNMNHQSMFFLS